MSETDKQRFDPEAFGDRVSDEMERNGWDITTLQERLKREKPDARGTSYASVWSYVKGQAPARGPRPEVVEGLSELFSVRPEYLLHGGPRTEADAALRAEEEPNPLDRLRAKIPELEEFDYSVQAALMTYMHRWVKAHVRVEREVTIEEAVNHAASVWEYMHGPLNAWAERVGKEVPIHKAGAEDYFMAMLHALNLSLQVAVPPGVDREQIESWPDLEEVEPST